MKPVVLNYFDASARFAKTYTFKFNQGVSREEIRDVLGPKMTRYVSPQHNLVAHNFLLDKETGTAITPFSVTVYTVDEHSMCIYENAWDSNFMQNISSDWDWWALDGAPLNLKDTPYLDMFKTGMPLGVDERTSFRSWISQFSPSVPPYSQRILPPLEDIKEAKIDIEKKLDEFMTILNRDNRSIKSLTQDVEKYNNEFDQVTVALKDQVHAKSKLDMKIVQTRQERYAVALDVFAVDFKERYKKVIETLSDQVSEQSRILRMIKRSKERVYTLDTKLIESRRSLAYTKTHYAKTSDQIITLQKTLNMYTNNKIKQEEDEHERVKTLNEQSKLEWERQKEWYREVIVRACERYFRAYMNDNVSVYDVDAEFERWFRHHERIDMTTTNKRVKMSEEFKKEITKRTAEIEAKRLAVSKEKIAAAELKKREKYTKLREEETTKAKRLRAEERTVNDNRKIMIENLKNDLKVRELYKKEEEERRVRNEEYNKRMLADEKRLNDEAKTKRLEEEAELKKRNDEDVKLNPAVKTTQPEFGRGTFSDPNSSVKVKANDLVKVTNSIKTSKEATDTKTRRGSERYKIANPEPKPTKPNPSKPKPPKPND